MWNKEGNTVLISPVQFFSAFIFLNYFPFCPQDPRSNFATEKNKFLTSVPNVYAAGGEVHF